MPDPRASSRVRARVAGLAALLFVLAGTAGRAALGADGQPAGQTAAAPVTLEPVDQFGGAMRAVAAQGDLALVGIGSRLVALSVADPAHPQPIGQTPDLGDVVQDIAWRGDRAWLALGPLTCAIDVSDVTAPRVLDCRSMGAAAFADTVVVHGGFAWFYGSAWFVDTWTVWRAPIDEARGYAGDPVAVITVPAPINALAIAGNTLYIGGGSTGNNRAPFLRAYDVASPTAPRRLWERRPTSDVAVMAVTGDRLLVAIGGYDGTSVVTVYQEAAAGVAREVWTGDLGVKYPSELELAPDGQLVLLAYYRLYTFELLPGGAVVRRGAEFVDGQLVNGYFIDLAIVGQRLFLATSQEAGLLLLDLTPTALWTVQGQLAAPDMVEDIATTAEHVFVSGVADYTVWAYRRDRQDPLAPPVRLPGLSAAGLDTAFHDNVLFTARGDLSAWDVADPTAPRRLGSAALPSEGQRVAVLGDLALVERWEVDGDVIFAVADLFDVSNSARLRRLAGLGPTGGAPGEPLAGGYLFLTDHRSGLRVYDVADTANIRQIATLELGWARALVTVATGDRLYVVGTDLATIDVSIPTQPCLVDRLPVPGNPGDVVDATRVGARLAVLYEDRLDVYDLPAVGQPVRVATGRTRWLGNGLALRDGLLYVADSVAGVTVWRIPEDLPVPPTATPAPPPTPSATPPEAPVRRPWAYLPMAMRPAASSGR